MLSQQHVSQWLQAAFASHRCASSFFGAKRKIQIFQHAAVGTLFDLCSEGRCQFSLFGDCFQDRVFSGGQFLRPSQHVLDGTQLAFVEAARGMAIRMIREGGADFQARVSWLFRETLGRQPVEDELRLLAELHTEQGGIFAMQPEKATAFLKVGDLPAPADIPAAELAAATVVASALLNLDETITLR